MSTLQGKAIIGQSGGPTAAINATLAGVIAGCFESRTDGTGITGVLGMKNGIEGFMQENIVDLYAFFKTYYEEKLDERKIELLRNTPAAALGSCRKKLPNPAEDPAFYETLINLFKKYEIRYFFYIGGNDSMDTVAKLTEYLKTSDYEMRVMGVPKTIDNDLYGTDTTIGYDTALNTIMECVDKIRDTASSHERLFIVEVMGRDAGFLALNGTIATGAEACVLPEIDPEFERINQFIANGLRRTKSSSIVLFAEGREKDYNIMEVADGMRQRFPELDVRVSILGYLQRGGSPTANDRILASRLGVASIDALLEGQRNVMIGLRNNELVYVPFTKAIKDDKPIDRDTVRAQEILAS